MINTRKLRKLSPGKISEPDPSWQDLLDNRGDGLFKAQTKKPQVLTYNGKGDWAYEPASAPDKTTYDGFWSSTSDPSNE